MYRLSPALLQYLQGQYINRGSYWLVATPFSGQTACLIIALRAMIFWISIFSFER
jgi:hypothetical protein